MNDHPRHAQSSIFAPSVDVDTDREEPVDVLAATLDEQKRAEWSRLRAVLGWAKQAEPNVIDERYEIVRTLGSGGMGVVYLARDRELENTEIALKVVRESYLRDVPTAPHKLRREAQQMAKLRRHPHVVTMLDVATGDASAYLTMEFVDGQNLRRWLEVQPRSLEEKLEAFLGAARGLHAAHEIGIVHRDFKPDNVLVDEQGVAKVTDFGIADLADDEVDQEADTRPDIARARSKSSAIGGTLAYIAPEQLAGERPDARSDQFSFCIAMWEGLTGERPYTWHGRKSQRDALSRPPHLASALPPWLRRLLLRGMSLERRNRHPDMTVLIERLEWSIGRKRRRKQGIGIAATFVTAAVFGIVIQNLMAEPPPTVAPTCEPFVATIDQHWSPSARSALESQAESLGVDLSWTLTQLDSIAEAWSNAATSTCEEDQAPPRDDPQRVCLEAWLIPFDNTIDLLGRGDVRTLARAPDLFAALLPPNNDFCVVTPLPQDPTLFEFVSGARGAAVVDARDRAEELSTAAVERAEMLAGDAGYSFELAHAHAARADVLRYRRDFDAAGQAYAIAEKHALGVADLPGLLHLWVMWAKALGLSRETELAYTGLGHLERAEPLVRAAALSKDALIRGELMETRALLDRNLGRLDDAASGYHDAITFYDDVGNRILAARAQIGAGVLALERGQLEVAVRELGASVQQLESEGVPPNYPRLVYARYNLAVALFERSFEVEDAAEAGRLGSESLTVLESVAAMALPPLRLQAIGTACQIAAQLDQPERLRALAELGRNAMKAGEATSYPDDVVVQIAVASMVGLHDATAEQKVESLLTRTPALALDLRWPLGRDWVEYLERQDRCADVARAVDVLTAMDDLPALEEFQTWARQREQCP